MSTLSGEGDIRLFKKTLVRKLGLSVIFAFVSSGLVFLLLQQVAFNRIEAKYRDAVFVAEQMKKEVYAIQRYITDNKISIQNFYKITQWLDRDKITAISLYYEDRLIYHSDISYRAGTLSSGIKRKPLPWETLYPIKFQDVEVQMSLTVYLKHHDYNMALLGNLILFFVLFISIVLFFVQRKTAAILRLEQQVQLMQGGTLDLPIDSKGNDEIASLAESLDEMRRVFINQIREEKERAVSSKQFASTMAHDIRTPLAALIGYLDILIHKRTSDEEKSRQYLIKSAEKAAQLGILTERLFDHFVVSQKNAMLAGHEACIDYSVLETLIFDCVFLLESEGFRVEIKTSECRKYGIPIYRVSLQRVLDNLISNILKYADKEAPVFISVTVEHSLLTISFLNAVRADKNGAVSTGFGLKACRSLLEEQGGSLFVNDDGTHFQVELNIELE